MTTTTNLYKLTVRRTKDSEDYYQIRHEDLEDIRDHILYLCCDECKSDLKYTEGDGIHKHIASLIEMIETPTTKKIGNVSSKRMTASWYKDSATKEDLKCVENALKSACRKFNKEDVLYTLPKQLVVPDRGKPKIQVRGYPPSECFLYAGTRATNLYSHKTVMIHAFNRYPLVSVSSYLQDYGFPVDPDHFALTELIQWVWRSAIREGKPIKLCIIPIRMRRLFDGWL